MRSVYLVALAVVLAGCPVEGEDAALFNNVNELIIVGQNTRGYDFDHYNTKMVVELHTSDRFVGRPIKRLHLKWIEYDHQQNLVPTGETSDHFFNPISPGDYYAVAYIDLNRNSLLDYGEPYDVWADYDGYPEVVRVREESRWKLTFYFEATYSSRRPL